MLSSQTSIEVRKQVSPIDLPFADRSVEFVTAVCVYHHVHGEARRHLTNEIKRVLTPGGLCCVIEHNPWNPVTRAIVKRCPVDVDAELLNAPSARLLLRASGFEPVSTDYFLYFPESLFLRFGPLERLLYKLPLGGQYALLARAPS
jgi:SAM-dependent methyltransferase